MTDNPLSTDTSWKESLAGDNEDHMQALDGYNSPDELFGSLASAQNFDWRSEAAGDDDKFKSQLERFDSIGAFANSFREAQQKISSGQLRDELPANATDDQIKNYREANGVPLEAGGYLENLPDGLVLGEEDKEIFASFAESLHNINASPAIAHAALSWYNDFSEMQQDALAESDHVHHVETEDALRQEWGTDYRTNINITQAWLEKNLDGDTRDFLLNSRGPDGRALMNNTGILNMLANVARQEMHPMSIPGQTGSDPIKATDDRIAEIEKFMREDRAAYNKDEKIQAELRNLYDIRAKHQAA